MTRLALPLTLAERQRAEKAEAEKKTYESGWLEAEGIISDLQGQVERAEAKRDEYHDIANAYAAWAGDILELLEERLGELDMDSPSDEALKRLMDRAQAGIASEVRRSRAVRGAIGTKQPQENDLETLYHDRSRSRCLGWHGTCRR